MSSPLSLRLCDRQKRSSALLHGTKTMPWQSLRQWPERWSVASYSYRAPEQTEQREALKPTKQHVPGGIDWEEPVPKHCHVWHVCLHGLQVNHPNGTVWVFRSLPWSLRRPSRRYSSGTQNHRRSTRRSTGRRRPRTPRRV